MTAREILLSKLRQRGERHLYNLEEVQIANGAFFLEDKWDIRKRLKDARV